MSRKIILVTGATGKQGGALIDALLSENDAAGFDIVAVTRDVSTQRAKNLAARRHVSVLAGDLDDPEAMFAAAVSQGSPVWGVYSVQVNSDVEETQGKALVDAAAAHGVRHFVYASGDRGGPDRSPNNPTTVRNFVAKHHIEQYLRVVSSSSSSSSSSFDHNNMIYTILRPVSFMENISNDLHGRGFARMWQQMGPDKTLQLVSTRDVGWFAAQAFLHPDDPIYRNAALTLVGDELTQPQADAVFRRIVAADQAMPLAPCPVASAVKFVLKGTVGDMFHWFEAEGYGGDVQYCRRLHPAMMDFAAWIEANKKRWLH